MLMCRRLISILILSLNLANFGYAASAPLQSEETQSQVRQQFTMLSSAWLPLVQRLIADNLYDKDIEDALLSFEVPSPDPMGRKIYELYKNKFSPPPPPPPPPLNADNKPKKPSIRIYPNLLKPENIQKCQDYLALHAASFDYAEKTYQVPKEIAVALLFIETRLGQNLGKSNVVYTLASMANSIEAKQIESYFDKLNAIDPVDLHLDWINETMQKRSNWAYKELKALLTHVKENKLSPINMPGSIYGAMGLCQFMPSNFAPYGADGNADGIVNLFTEADAIASLSNYLAKHGWKPNLTRLQKHGILMRYNRLNIYANSILALADSVAGRKPPLVPQKAVPKKAAAKKNVNTKAK